MFVSFAGVVCVSVCVCGCLVRVEWMAGLFAGEHGERQVRVWLACLLGGGGGGRK